MVHKFIKEKWIKFHEKKLTFHFFSFPKKYTSGRVKNPRKTLSVITSVRGNLTKPVLTLTLPGKDWTGNETNQMLRPRHGRVIWIFSPIKCFFPLLGRYFPLQKRSFESAVILNGFLPVFETFSSLFETLTFYIIMVYWSFFFFKLFWVKLNR